MKQFAQIALSLKSGREAVNSDTFQLFPIKEAVFYLKNSFAFVSVFVRVLILIC